MKKINLYSKDFQGSDTVKKSTVDDLIMDILCGHELEGYIDGKKACILNLKEDYITFSINSRRINIPEEDLDTAILYKNKTLKELLEEDIFYDIVVY